MPNLIPQDIREWMRRMEFKTNDLTRRMSSLIPGDIADGVNLDGFTSSGRWRRRSTVGTTTALNYPFNGVAGTLEVYWDPNYTQIQQVFHSRIGGVFTRWFNGTSWSSWVSAGSDGLPTMASASAAGTQTISAGTPSPLPNPVNASLTLPPGTTLVMALMSCMVGSGTGFSPASSGSARYWLSGAISYQPGSTNSAGIGGVNVPIGSGGGTIMQVHSVTVTAATSLTIEARALRHTGSADWQIRGVNVQLVPLRRV